MEESWFLAKLQGHHYSVGLLTGFTVLLHQCWQWLLAPDLSNKVALLLRRRHLVSTWEILSRPTQQHQRHQQQWSKTPHRRHYGSMSNATDLFSLR